MSFDSKAKKFGAPRKALGGIPRRQSSENGVGTADLRSVLAKKQAANITDLRAKLKPKALYTSKLASRSQQPPPQLQGGASSTNGGRAPGSRKPLKLTASFKNSVSSAVTSPPRSTRPSRSSRSAGPVSHSRSRPSSHKLPSYEEAKKISVTVPGLSRPVTEYQSHRREERLAAQIARSKETRQDSYMRGREEFLASTITSAVGSGGGVASGGGSGAERERERERSMGGMFNRMPRAYPSRSPSPPAPLADYNSPYDPLYPLGSSFHHKAPPPPPSSSYSSSGGRGRGITTATSMFISNLSDTVSKNDVAELCSVVGSLDGVYMHAPGIAEVVFKYKDDALEAYKKYNQRNLDGQPMHCKLQAASRSRITTSSYGHSYSDDLYSHSHSHSHTNSGFYG